MADITVSTENETTTETWVCDVDEANRAEPVAEEKPTYDKNTARFYNLLKVIFQVCHIAGFKLEGRVHLRDMKTGKLWE